MAGPTIGSIRGTIEIDYDGKGIIKAQNDVDNLGKKSGSTAAGFDKLGTGLAVVGGVIAGGFAVATASAVSFEKQMSAVGAVSNASGDELNALREKALQLGKDTQFSASEAGQAIEELVKAGLSVTDVLNGAADATVALAAAGGIDLPQAATIAANAMNQFGLSAKDLNGVVDTIAGAANASAIDVGEFGQSLSQVGAVAHLAGQNFNDTATAIALLGNAGIKGSDAGTSLKTFLSNLVPTTLKAKEAFKELGLNVGASGNAFINANGSFKSFEEIAGVLNTATKGLSESQKQVALETIFGSDAIRAASIIAEQGAAGFNKLNTEMGKSTAADVAAARMDNAAGSIEQFKGSLETLGIEVGSKFIPLLRSIVDGANNLVNGFGKLSAGTQQAIIIILASVGGLSLLGFAIIKVAKGIRELIVVGKALKAFAIIMKEWTIFTKLAAAAQWLFNLSVMGFPLVWILVAIAAVVAGIILLWKNSETFRKIVTGAWNGIKAVIGAVVDWLVGSAWPWIQKVWDGIVNGVKAVLNFLKPLWDGIVLVFAVAVSAIEAVFAVWKTVVLEPVLFVLGLLLSAVKAVLDPIVALFVWAFGLVSDEVTKRWNEIKAITLVVWEFLKPYVMAAVNFIVAVITTAWNAASAVFTAVWGVISAFFSGIWDVIVGIVSAGVKNVGLFVDSFKNFLNKIKAFFDGLKAAADGGIGELIKFVGTIPGKILNALGDLAGMLYQAGRNIIQGLINGISSMFGKVRSAVESGLSTVRNLLPFSPAKDGPFSGKGWTLYSGMSLVKGFADGISRASNLPVEAMAAAVAGVAGSVSFSAPAATSAAPRRAPGTPPPAAGLNIGVVQVQGVWDFTDPAGTRQMVGALNDELDKYQKGYK